MDCRFSRHPQPADDRWGGLTGGIYGYALLGFDASRSCREIFNIVIRKYWFAAARFEEIDSSPDYKIVVIEGGGLLSPRFAACPRVQACCALTLTVASCADPEKGKIIATASLLIERKFIRSCGKVGTRGELQYRTCICCDCSSIETA